MIVPAFNAEATLAETLACVAAQTYEPIELLIVDDGSTDGTRRAAERFCENHELGTVLAQANGGVAKARNRAIAEARGVFLAPLDADDLWHPTYIEKMVAAARRPTEPPVLVYSHARVVDASSRIVASGHQHAVEGPAAYAMQYCNLVGTGSGMMVRADACRRAGAYSETLHSEGLQGCEDYLLQMRLAVLGPIAAAGEYLVGYRLGQGNMSADRRRMFASELRAREIFRQDRTLEPPPRWLDRWISAGVALRHANAAFLAGAARESAHALLRAWACDPAGATQALRGRIAQGRRAEASPAIDFGASACPTKAVAGDARLAPGPFASHQARRLARIYRLDRETGI